MSSASASAAGRRRATGSPAHPALVERAHAFGNPGDVDHDANIRGVEGVIDKDFASAVLGLEIGAKELFILTVVERVALHFGTEQQKFLETLSVAEARSYLAEGHFPAGSRGPKIDAACRFIHDAVRAVH